MKARLAYGTVEPAARKALLDLENFVVASGLEESLLDLVRLRASQINGCAYCLDMHTKDARARGETEQRLYALSAWWDAPFYTERERAALAWTEAVTRIADGHVSDEIYEQARRQFTEQELVRLNMAVVAINSWNRMNIAFRTVAGSYQPALRRNEQTRTAPQTASKG